MEASSVVATASDWTQGDPDSKVRGRTTTRPEIGTGGQPLQPPLGSAKTIPARKPTFCMANQPFS